MKLRLVRNGRLLGNSSLSTLVEEVMKLAKIPLDCEFFAFLAIQHLLGRGEIAIIQSLHNDSFGFHGGAGFKGLFSLPKFGVFFHVAV